MFLNLVTPSKRWNIRTLSESTSSRWVVGHGSSSLSISDLQERSISSNGTGGRPTPVHWYANQAVFEGDSKALPLPESDDAKFADDPLVVIPPGLVFLSIGAGVEGEESEVPGGLFEAEGVVAFGD